MALDLGAKVEANLLALMNSTAAKRGVDAYYVTKCTSPWRLLAPPWIPPDCAPRLLRCVQFLVPR